MTDNASNMKSTWKLISDMYPSNYFTCYGCCANILNLFAQDILKLEPNNKQAKVDIEVVNNKIKQVGGICHINCALTI